MSANLIVVLLTLFGSALSESAGGWIDCGGQRVSGKHYLCCDGVPHPIIQGKREICCGKDKIDMYGELCCDGVVSLKFAYVECCGTETFYTRGYMCCGDIVYSKSPGASCCGDTYFDRALQMCRDGKVVDKNIF